MPRRSSPSGWRKCFQDLLWSTLASRAEVEFTPPPAPPLMFMPCNMKKNKVRKRVNHLLCSRAKHGRGRCRLGRHFEFVKPKIILLIFLRIKKLLDIWIIFWMQFVPHCLFSYFLNMQQSWAGQSKLHSKIKATAAQHLKKVAN
jgi:hypothetical protein